MIPAAAKKIAAARRLHGFWTQVNGNIDDHAVGQLHVFQEIKNAAAETRLNLSRLRFGANGFSLGSGRFSLGAGCFSFFRCRRTGDFPLRFVQRLVGERIGFAILLAINVLDAERIEGLGHFLSALEKRSEEHTSELQSHHDLVCRLLLEKKKYLYYRHVRTTNLSVAS